MSRLSEQDKKKIIELIEQGKILPSNYKNLLFDHDDIEYVERTGIYRLEYKGKTREQEIIANTPSAPLQEVRSFNSDNTFEDSWQNMLIYGDNLLALKAIYDDQRGENHYGSKNKIKLIYIDPPFATKQDFMKDKEKAYRDKIVGAQFIEFLRKRLILMREILASDGSIYVHLDWKKGHYIKAIMDEVFGEFNFQNEIVWKRTSAHSDSTTYANIHDLVLYYSKTDAAIFNPQYIDYTEEYIKERYKHTESGSDGKIRRYADDNLIGAGLSGGGYDYEWKGIRRIWRCPLNTMKRYESENRIYYTREGVARIKRYIDELPGGVAPSDVWQDIFPVNSQAEERVNYPTQKPERFIERVIKTSSNENDIVLDAFVGSGSTLTTAEKLSRRWIGIDCGKLAIYTAQKRLLNLTSQVGSTPKDERREYERVSDFLEHSKETSRGLLLVYDKARKGDLIINDALLEDLHLFLDKYISGKKNETYSLICPEDKFQVETLEVIDNEDQFKAGEKIVNVGRISFLISFIQSKIKASKPKSLKAKSFALFNAGVYDNDKVKELPWEKYKPFVMQLFGMRLDPHKVRGFEVDGWIGSDRAFVWNWPNQKKLILDEEYVKSLHKALGGRAGDRFYVIAPVVAMGFMTDEMVYGKTRYVFLKVPVSILERLISAEDPGGALKQPMSEDAINEVIDAVGFDFVSQPIVEKELLQLDPENQDLFNTGKKDYVIRLKEFRAKTLVTDPEDFPNFATLSIVLLDNEFNGDVFNLTSVAWIDELIDNEINRIGTEITGELDKKAEACEYLDIRIPEDECGTQIMAIFIDKYGNEKKLIINSEDF